jgi:hypothetical protein
MPRPTPSLKFFSLLVTVAIFTSLPTKLGAQATLLLEEPYRYDGTFAGTGHTAVYLSRVCADSPTVLRRCQPGETGVVLSRYNGIAGRDWIAVPLIPYLYAVGSPEHIPLIADTRLVSFLRQQYLTKNLLATTRDWNEDRDSNEDKNTGEQAAYQLVGSAYDRTTYAYRIATRPEQDDDLIRILNSSPNRESYALLKRNCADFVKQIINFYYPKAVHRAIIADFGVMTPKQAAKSLVHAAKRRPEMKLTTFIIPQVPGLKRSKPVHGVIESLLAKKYVAPFVLFHPILVVTVETAYWAGWRFNPANGALVFDPSSLNPARQAEKPNIGNIEAEQFSGLEPALTAAERRSYERSVAGLRRTTADSLPNWRKFQAEAEPQLDPTGRPFLQLETAGSVVQVGVCRDNALSLPAPQEVVQELLFTRLEEELKSGKPTRTSLQQIETDFHLLEQAVEARQAFLLEQR